MVSNIFTFRKRISEVRSSTVSAGCSDVVKKPKLDQHRLRCNASFTCIDCSKTFPTPADWKGHISCITEAEKYQKSLYKPKNNRDGAQNYNIRGQDSNFKNNNTGSWGRDNNPRFRATGANDTPLGTPLRMSPKLDTFTPDGDSQKAETSTIPLVKKRKADEMSSDKPPAENPKKIESIKKRKSDTKEPNHDTVGICSELPLYENTIDNLKTSAGASMEPEANSEDKADAGKKEKKKDRKKRKEEKDQDVIANESSKFESERDGKKVKKHKKDRRKEERSDTPSQKEDMQNEKENQIVEEEKKEKKKKSKVTKKEGLKDGSDENVKPGDVSDGDKKEKKDKKKSEDKESQDVVKKEGKGSEEENDVSSKLDEPSAAKIEKEKSKSSKKRKHAEDTEGTSEKVKVVVEKKKKKKN